MHKENVLLTEEHLQLRGMNKRLFDNSMEFRLSIEEGFKVDAACIDLERQKELGISDLGNEDRGSVLGI